MPFSALSKSRNWAFLSCVLALATGGYFAYANELKPLGTRFENLPPSLAKRYNRDAFPELISKVDLETAVRERNGEFDHLIAYALQSNQFTAQTRIEPAVSAKAFAETGLVSVETQRRLQEFLLALPKAGDNPRLAYFARLIPAGHRTLPFLQDEYRKTMRFLYEKEFLHQEHAYETRGHSTDSQVAANYAVRNALAVLRSSAPGLQFKRVLIIGPGIDFAPRTSLVDAVPPQSFQPYLVADALLSLRLSTVQDLEIDCVDINGRVIEFINSFADGPKMLQLYSETGTEEFNNYFASIGQGISKRAPRIARPALSPEFLSRVISVSREVSLAVHATKLNITTQWLPKTYDVAIATNILLYFGPTELPLALNNIASMLNPGAYFIHNDLRPETAAVTDMVGLEAIQARTVLIAKGKNAPLYDSFTLTRKR